MKQVREAHPELCTVSLSSTYSAWIEAQYAGEEKDWSSNLDGAVPAFYLWYLAAKQAYEEEQAAWGEEA